jgi:phosphoglycolate phosphatase-like HAD superfamily hydrolase
MSNQIEVLVFDLDGTLASTANLSSGRRVPNDVLKLSPPEFTKSPFLFREELKFELSLALQCGVKVIVITRAPQAYASTLMQLLGIDFTECIAASSEFDSRESKIIHIQEKYQTPMRNILYLGDLSADEVAAKSVGCNFEYPYWLMPEESESQALQESSLYNALLAEIMEDEEDLEEDFESKYLTHYQERLVNRYELLSQVAMGQVFLDPEGLVLMDSEKGLPIELQVFNNPIASAFTFKPAINPDFMTRNEYESDYECLGELVDLVKSLFNITKLVPGDFNARRERFLGTEIRSFTRYMNTLLGDGLWHKCKNWQNKEIGSGAEVHLHILELVAIVMASFLTEQAILIPVPSTPYSQKKPGEISRRLTHRICQLRSLNQLDILSRDPSGKIVMEPREFILGGDYCLVDDQLTDGTTVEGCLDALPLEVSGNMSIMIWSYSSSGHRWVAQPL